MVKQNKPTAAEMEILAVLWEREAATVREVHEVISGRKPTAYTTVLKMLQIMTEKDLVERDAAERAHVYRAKLQQSETQTRFVTDIIGKLFNGSAAKLVLQVLETQPADADELKEIRRVIEEAERKAKENG